MHAKLITNISLGLWWELVRNQVLRVVAVWEQPALESSTHTGKKKRAKITKRKAFDLCSELNHESAKPASRFCTLQQAPQHILSQLYSSFLCGQRGGFSCLAQSWFDTSTSGQQPPFAPRITHRPPNRNNVRIMAPPKVSKAQIRLNPGMWPWCFLRSGCSSQE